MPSNADEGQAGRPPFDGLVAVHREAVRFHGMLLVLLVILGLLSLAGAALVSGPAVYPLFALGVFLLALAAVPSREIAERRDRIEGLGVLREEWDELVATVGPEGAARLRRLFDRLYRFAD